MSTWVFDLGNSRLKAAPLDVEGHVDAARRVEIAHDAGVLPAGWIAQLPERIDTALVASVATDASTAGLFDALAQRCTRITRARTSHECAGVRVAYAEPARLGVDRFLALLGARGRAAQAWLVVGIGTALTIDLLDAAGVHRGGRIAPSPTLMRQALHARAPQLPSRGGAYTEFATDTLGGLASGCEGAALALIADSRANARTVLGVAPDIVLHGGGGDALSPRLPGATLAPALVLEGLARWGRTFSV